MTIINETFTNEQLRDIVDGAMLTQLQDKIMARELLANRGACDQEVYANGKSVCLVDVPKDTAEVICRGISEATGCKVDWHYIGGRVHIKAIAPPAVPDFKKLARELVENLVDCGGAEDSSIKQYLKWTEKACRAAMLAQPVSQGWGKLNSPEIPDG